MVLRTQRGGEQADRWPSNTIQNREWNRLPIDLATVESKLLISIDLKPLFCMDQLSNHGSHRQTTDPTRLTAPQPLCASWPAVLLQWLQFSPSLLAH